MAPETHFPLSTPFKPAPALVNWFMIDFSLIVIFILACTVFPVLLSMPDALFYAVSLCGIVVVFVFFLYWVKLYYQSMWYELHEDEMRWKRGVWFRTTGIVPYNRITNLDLKQGPVMRWLRISTLSIQTAGYSGQAVPEIRIEAIEHAEELRELVRTLVRQSGSGIHNDGTGTSAPVQSATGSMSTNLLMLDELKKIRFLLEQKNK
ncbi:MAG: PH domain-containing protein [Methanoregula sp.]|nr:PH domain-containing protein [Methanoregula sp.]